MTVPEAVTEWCRQQGHGGITSERPVSGGCINNGARITTASGHTFFLKQNAGAPPDMFAREAEGLAALAVADGPRIPQPLLVGESYLLLEDLKPAAPAADYWERFGRQLARVHRTLGPAFGFDHDNYLGSTPQPNPPTEDGYRFFADHRLRFQAELAQRRGLLDQAQVDQVDRLAGRLGQLIPEQPPSLLHGDLWAGNATSDADGSPALIDPAAHYGWAEAELGMTTLFGRFPESFYRSYQEVRPLADGWRQRLPLYNLYHLLNHLNLFGQSYLHQVQSTLDRFGP